jgi:hypothetical protein
MADHLTPSARALAEALDDPKLGPKIRARIHGVSLSRFVHGVRRPGIDTAKEIEEITAGAVSVSGWARSKRERELARARKAA